jgi:Methylamine utilisation protein MauE
VSARCARTGYYQRLPFAAVGYGLPFLEIALGGLLLAGLAVRLAASVSATLLILFVAAIASAWLRGLQIDCGCFGGGGTVAAGHTGYGREITRDLALLAAALALIRWPRTHLAIDNVIDQKAPA